MKVPEPVVAVGIGLALAGLIAWLYWWERGDPGPRRPSARTEPPSVCAWCKWRDGAECTYPESPARGGLLVEVSAGKAKCNLLKHPARRNVR